MIRRAAPFILIVLIPVALLAIAASTGSATDDPVEIEIARYAVELDVQEDGSYEVTERITFEVRSGTMSFGTRHLPRRMVDGYGEIEVESAELGPLEVSTRSRDGNREVRWEHAPHPEGGTVVIRYRAEGALRDLGDRNEVFWAVVGPDWELPIRSVEARITLPASFVSEVGALEVEPESAAQLEDGRWVMRFAHGELEAGQAYQVRAAFPWVMEGRKLGLRRPEVQAALIAVVLLLVGLVQGLRGFRMWREGEPVRLRRRPEVRLEEAAALLHGGVGAERAFPALLLELARRGHLTLVRGGEDPEDADEVTVRIHPDAGDELHPFESEFLAALERYGTLGEFGKEGKEERKEALASLHARLIDRGLLSDRSHEARADKRSALSAALVGAAFVAAVYWWGPWYLLGAGLAFGFAFGRLIRGDRKLELTEEGRRLQGEVMGWLAELGEELERSVETAPLEVAARYVQALPWLTIDPGQSGKLEKELRDRLDEVDDHLLVPAWVEDRTTEARKAAEDHSAAYAAFFQVHETAAFAVMSIAPTVMTGSGVAGGSAAAVSVAGAAGAGAAGGGGGGAG